MSKVEGVRVVMVAAWHVLDSSMLNPDGRWRTARPRDRAGVGHRSRRGTWWQCAERVRECTQEDGEIAVCVGYMWWCAAGLPVLTTTAEVCSRRLGKRTLESTESTWVMHSPRGWIRPAADWPRSALPVKEHFVQKLFRRHFAHRHTSTSPP